MWENFNKSWVWLNIRKFILEINECKESLI